MVRTKDDPTKTAVLLELIKANPTLTSAQLGKLFTETTGEKIDSSTVRRKRREVFGVTPRFLNRQEQLELLAREFSPEYQLNVLKMCYKKAMEGNTDAAKLFLDRTWGKLSTEVNINKQVKKVDVQIQALPQEFWTQFESYMLGGQVTVTQPLALPAQPEKAMDEQIIIE